MEKTLSERIAEDKITCHATRLPHMSDDGLRGCWAVRLSAPDGKLFDLPDPYESNDTPTAFDVLDSVTAHCAITDQADDWQRFASEYIGDVTAEDAPSWRPRYFAWQEINTGLRAFLGHRGHDDYLYNTNRSR